MGLAIRYDPILRTIDTPDYDPQNIRVGTKRYMAPEILSNTLDTIEFSSYCRADIYSLGLVFWEILNRTKLSETHTPGPYQQPYQEFTQPDPSIAEMADVVVTRCIRPQFSRYMGKQLKVLTIKT